MAKKNCSLTGLSFNSSVGPIFFTVLKFLSPRSFDPPLSPHGQSIFCTVSFLRFSSLFLTQTIEKEKDREDISSQPGRLFNVLIWRCLSLSQITSYKGRRHFESPNLSISILNFKFLTQFTISPIDCAFLFLFVIHD